MGFVVLTVGKTHSGKTTFGKELVSTLGKYCLLDFDILVEFLKTTYPWLYEPSNFKTAEEANDAHYLSLKTRRTIFKQALKTDLPIIFTSANSLKKLRRDVCNLAHKENKKVIMVYFNRPEEILLERIGKNKRSKICLTRSIDFQDLLLNRQKNIFENPHSKEADIFFEINDDISWQEAQNNILGLLTARP